MPLYFKPLHPQATDEMIGFLPLFFSERDPRPAKEQAHANYGHGGGWDPMPGFTMLNDGRLKYPGDPPLPMIAEAHLRDEIIRLYDCAWVAIIQPDKSFEVCRMD